MATIPFLESGPTKILPVRLRELWDNGRQNNFSPHDCGAQQKLELDEYAAIWTLALLLPGEGDLVRSMLIELGRWHGLADLQIVRRRCEAALVSNKLEWNRSVHEVEARQVENFYDNANCYIDELIWWHTLAEDNSPLAYVAALEFALLANCKAQLDFGSGVGSGALLFRSYGFDVTLADISNSMLAFCKQRFAQRRRQASFIDLRNSTLPRTAFDFITAMDVFEHLVDPVGAVESLYDCLKPGGYIYGRFSADESEDRPQHIVRDFRPVFERFGQLGLKEVFRDDWLWGHQVFQKQSE